MKSGSSNALLVCLDINSTEGLGPSSAFCFQEIAEVTRNEASNWLQLNPGQKALIRDPVQSHTSRTKKEPMMETIVEGKGKALVILLHGPSGIGKTRTVERVALLAGKPLFAVSLSDVDLDATDVERNLGCLFEIAAR